MADFIRADLRGSRFERADLSGAQFRAVDLTGARFRGADLSGAVMRGVELAGTDIYGEIGKLTVTGVDVGPLVDAELNRRTLWRARRGSLSAGGR
ncbi:MAG: pentapeptide repeat-containing protein [Streptosporangiaceae bacterium]